MSLVLRVFYECTNNSELNTRGERGFFYTCFPFDDYALICTIEREPVLLSVTIDDVLS